jgi:uncharacterized cupredoxin-like copper-binding protein
MSYRIFALLSLAMLGLALAACAGTTPGAPAGAPTLAQPEEVQITLTEFKIDSSKTTFKKDVPYRFVITNKGTVAHEFVIAPRGEKEDSKFLTEVEEDELPVGASQTHEYTFTQTGDLEFSCHVPGHYEGGMVLPITVTE